MRASAIMRDQVLAGRPGVRGAARRRLVLWVDGPETRRRPLARYEALETGRRRWVFLATLARWAVAVVSGPRAAAALPLYARRSARLGPELPGLWNSREGVEHAHVTAS